MESLFKVEANHAIGCGFWKSFICILIKGNIMPINAIFGKTIIWSNYTFQKIMNLVWLDMLLKVGGNHQPGFEIWKPFECILEMGKESAI